MTAGLRRALALIGKYEGLRLKAYLCPACIWTIGYGHTGTDVDEGLEIDQAQAEAFLKDDAEEAEFHVDQLVKVFLNPNQKAALISFVFNLGKGNLKKSTLLRKLNEGDYDAVPEELKKWTRANGKILSGLVKRREEEAQLWQTPVK